MRSIRPLDKKTILDSVSRTKRLLVADNGWIHFGISSEIIALVTENIFDKLLCSPGRIGMYDAPSPSSRALANHTYPRAQNLVEQISKILNVEINIDEKKSEIPLDIPDPTFKGPF